MLLSSKLAFTENKRIVMDKFYGREKMILNLGLLSTIMLMPLAALGQTYSCEVARWTQSGADTSPAIFTRLFDVKEQGVSYRETFKYSQTGSEVESSGDAVLTMSEHHGSLVVDLEVYGLDQLAFISQQRIGITGEVPGVISQTLRLPRGNATDEAYLYQLHCLSNND